jgi:hypothetical protein
VATTRHETKVLTSWKEIAAYFGKGVRTVQRWEQQFGLPVSRPRNSRKGVVFASPDELDRWLAVNWSQQTGHKDPAEATDSLSGIAASINDFRRLRQANRALIFDLSRAMEGLHGESQELARTMSHPAGTNTRVVENRNPLGSSALLKKRRTG